MKITYPNVKSTLFKARKKTRSVFPVIKNKFETVIEFSDHLQSNPYLLQSDVDGFKSNLSSHLISSTKRTSHLLLYNEKIFSQYTKNQIFLDGW